MERWAGRVAVVTGASVGIGAAIVHKLLDEGSFPCEVVLSFRRRNNVNIKFLLGISKCSLLLVMCAYIVARYEEKPTSKSQTKKV